MIDFISTMPHYEAHLRPVYDALPEERRGQWIRHAGSNVRRSEAEMLVCASFADLKATSRVRMLTTMKGMVAKYEKGGAPVAMFEHGAGFTFPESESYKRGIGGGSYAGGPLRVADLFPSTNRWVAKANLARNPQTPAPIVGCPKLDAMWDLAPPDDGPYTIAVSFHWDCHVAPETRWAMPEFRSELRRLRAYADERGWRIIGHGHPRAQSMLKGLWTVCGFEFVPRFEDVCAQAHMYVADATSTIYEFAAMDRPVVVMNSKNYRRDVQQGLRFWDHADVGVQCERGGLIAAIEEAYHDSPAQQRLRHDAIDNVYPHLGNSANVAAQALLDFLEQQ